jgi:tetraacyldisaccharide 4'-kinase
VWLEEREQSGWRAAGLLPLIPAAWLYAAGARMHRALYAPGRMRKTRLPIRVLSVGNLMVGGTGKTPTAAWLASALRQRGHRVALASRGYGRSKSRRNPVLIVSDGRYVKGRVETAGDEPMLLAAHAPGVPVLVGNDRAHIGLRAIAAFGTEVLVLDDGFHHHPLYRDVDWVTVDGQFGFGNRWVLPRGPLRESIAALRFADAIGVVDGPLAAEDEVLIDRFAPNAIRYAARREPVSVRVLGGGGETSSPESLNGAAVGLLSALARPASLRNTLEQLGAKIIAERCFRDHHRYRRQDLRDLQREAPLWVTSEKDALKIMPEWVGGADLRVLSIRLKIEQPDPLLDWLEDRLR